MVISISVFVFFLLIRERDVYVISTLADPARYAQGGAYLPTFFKVGRSGKKIGAPPYKLVWVSTLLRRLQVRISAVDLTRI